VRKLRFLPLLVLLPRRGVGLDHLPPRLDDHRSGRPEAVEDAARCGRSPAGTGGSGFGAPRPALDHRDDRRRRGDVVVVPGREEATDDEVIELLLVGTEAARHRWRRNDRVVIRHLRVVHEPRAERPLGRPFREERPVLRLERADDARQRRGHVAREVPAVGPRVGDRLSLLVEPLRHLERLLRAPSEEPVRVPLQLRQVEELRGR
jgi:hypothetical protein